MDYLKLMKERHSVRQFKEIPISQEDAEKLEEKVKEVNEKSGLNFKLVLNDMVAFSGLLPKYGSFKNAYNYIICAGIDRPDFEERYGYYGEELVLYAQSLGLNSCWVGLTMNKKAIRDRIDDNDKMGCVIALGYGETQGTAHKSKDVAKITNVPSPWPQWFHDGMLGAMLAPTAVNQQKFKVSMTGDGKVSITAGRGFFSQVDLGIVKYQFEMAAGKDFPGFA